VAGQAQGLPPLPVFAEPTSHTHFTDWGIVAGPGTAAKNFSFFSSGGAECVLSRTRRLEVRRAQDRLAATFFCAVPFLRGDPTVYRRLAPIFLLSCLLALGLSGCKNKKVPGKTYELSLLLPASVDVPNPNPNGTEPSKLTIDGKDYSEPRDTKRAVTIEGPPDRTTVQIVFAFWPNTYTSIVRTREVTLLPDKTTEVDLRQPQESDKIKVIYVPTPNEVVEKMCEMAKIGPNDVVYDIGCGDGRMVIRAVKKFGAKKGVGIDYNPERIQESQANAKKEGVEDKVTFRQGDALEIKDFSEANVVLLYLGDHLMEALRPTLQKTLKPGSRIVSHRFLMRPWAPDKTITIQAKNNRGVPDEYRLHLWTVK
jgi:precorrin-6B methylase 2